MQINQNVMALRTQGTLAVTQSRLEKSIQKLSSGLRINSAADDAAGLAISEKLRRQVRGLTRAVANAQDGISMIQTGEGALNESTSILQRMRELAVQAGNDTLTGNDRLEIQKEVYQLRDDLNRISRNTEFNTKKLLDGSQTASFSSSSNAAKGIVNGQSGTVAGDFSVSIALVTGGMAMMSRSQIFTKSGLDPTVLAEGSTQLQSIAQFYDANGVFALESPGTINLQGNDKTTSISIDGQMTLDKLAASLQNAVAGNSGLNLDNSRVGVVGTAQTLVAGMGGYIQITSGKIGSDGEFGILADQPILTALGFSVSRESKNNLHQVTVTDSHGSGMQVRTEGSNVKGLLDGIDVKFASQAAQLAGSGGIEQGLLISSAITFTVSAGGGSAGVALASGYWTMEGIARAIGFQVATTVAATTISGMSAMVVDGEIRLSYTPPSASISSTINISGATVAVTLGFLNGTYSGFVDGKKDVNNIDWVMSTYDDKNASYTVQFSVGDGVNSYDLSVYTTLSVMTSYGAAASGADAIQFSDFQASANKLMVAGSVQVRIDQTNGSMAFTALRVGRENDDNAAAIDSEVILNVQTVNTMNRFGMDSALSVAARGSGDKNFKVRVTDNAPVFQIGADQGETMKVAFANMSADALGVGSLDMTSIHGAEVALGKLNMAIDKVSAERSKLGAFQNRLEYSINNLRNTQTNLTAAESRIRDTDVSTEMIEFTRDQIVSQSGNAMLAQANTIPQSVLQLLK
ncbi:MAG: hypothetical protein HQM09_00510 [Candidatus Riflebacteria bacterium]|nr:hypothetical protein [Candidatus Riflebacteria bacterium]